ncbi:unnamed protein product [marine sediment metagenome]|uniref:Uncharacterized protein n=1 Tax=marine sediment metagenome TaxID=412755 RepID=X1BER0_9ZZZZ
MAIIREEINFQANQGVIRTDEITFQLAQGILYCEEVKFVIIIDWDDKDYPINLKRKIIIIRDLK